MTYVLKVHHYDNTIDHDTYRELCSRMARDHVQVFTSMRGVKDTKELDYWNTVIKLDEVTIDTAHLFNNQWNTMPIPGVSDSGLRVFHWHEFHLMPTGRARTSRLIKGYWLELTKEFKLLLDNTMTCGYCGKQEAAAKGYVFCPHCLDSEYLKSSDLHLTRMMPVSYQGKRSPLKIAEEETLLPAYRDAQLKGSTAQGKARITKAFNDVHADYSHNVKIATTERDGKLWLLEHCPQVYRNAIYYPHTDRYCFGWRSPIDAELLDELLNVISEFPFEYDIKCSDGRVLSSGG